MTKYQILHPGNDRIRCGIRSVDDASIPMKIIESCSWEIISCGVMLPLAPVSPVVSILSFGTMLPLGPVSTVVSILSCGAILPLAPVPSRPRGHQCCQRYREMRGQSRGKSCYRPCRALRALESKALDPHLL
jgi:hypothetical protein